MSACTFWENKTDSMSAAGAACGWQYLSPVTTDRILASGLKAAALIGPLCSLALNTTVSPAAAVSTTLTTPNSDPRATRLLCMLLARHLALMDTGHDQKAVKGKAMRGNMVDRVLPVTGERGMLQLLWHHHQN